jgi:chemotaxis protein histidine kinase CheA
MPPPPPALPATADSTRHSPGAWLDHLEQALLQADLALAQADSAADWRQALHGLAGDPAATRHRDLAAALLALVGRLDTDASQPTSAMLDLMLRATEALRTLQDGGPRALPPEELDDLLFDLQAQASGFRAAPRAGPSVPGPGSAAAPAGAGVDEPPWSAIDALLAGLGPLAEALAELPEVLHSPAPARATGSPVGRVQQSLRSLSVVAQALKTAHASRLPNAPDLQEMLALRAGSHECLVPASAVVACSPGAGPATAGELDLAAWLASPPAQGPAAEPDAARLRLAVASGAATATWVIDEVLPPRIVAVQPLARHFRAVPGVSGTAVVGATRLLLVLDPATMGAAPTAAASAAPTPSSAATAGAPDQASAAAPA